MIRTRQFDILNESSQVRDSDLAEIAAAVTKGLLRDFAGAGYPAGSVHLVRKKVRGHIPIHVKDGLDEPGAAGYHTDEHNQPVIYVDAGSDPISLTIDHEAKETLADPFGNDLVPMTINGIRVEVLREVCDPPESVKRAYLVDGWPVSDFCLKTYYEPIHANMRTTFHGRNLAPGNVDRDGYLSYVKADGTWEQITWFGGNKPQVRVLGRADEFKRPDEMLREAIDRVTQEFRRSA